MKDILLRQLGSYATMWLSVGAILQISSSLHVQEMAAEAMAKVWLRPVGGVTFAG